MKAKITSVMILLPVLLPMLLANNTAMAHESAATETIHAFQHMLVNDPASIFALIIFMLVIIGVVKTGGDLRRVRK